MVERLADLERVLVELSDGQLLESVSERGPGDRQWVGRIGLPGSRPVLRIPATGFDGASQDPLAPAQQEPLQPPETCPQSSIAQTRSESSSRRHASSWPCPVAVVRRAKLLDSQAEPTVGINEEKQSCPKLEVNRQVVRPRPSRSRAVSVARVSVIRPANPSGSFATFCFAMARRCGYRPQARRIMRT
ncbi:MAG TPA: hypothetical protein VMJ65_14045 [Solirubrobacteraceae bacterium]|nr:hypothetical protein [Solirubrobacteraceae bacterium]